MQITHVCGTLEAFTLTWPVSDLHMSVRRDMVMRTWARVSVRDNYQFFGIYITNNTKFAPTLYWIIIR